MGGLNTPGKTLPDGPWTRRPVAVVAQMPHKYNVREVFIPPASCHGNAHSEIYMTYPDEYRLHLCRFWAFTFNRPESTCHLERLPSFGQYPDSLPVPELSGRREAVWRGNALVVV